MSQTLFLEIARMAVFIFLHRFVLFYAIYSAILRYYGFAPIIMSLCMVSHEVGKLMADMHSGAMADKYGIRRVMSVGLCIKAVGIMLWIPQWGLAWFVLGMFLLGIGRSCTVGKIEAYVYNMLSSLDKQEMFQSVWLVIFLIDGMSAVVVSWLAGWLYNAGGFSFVLICSVLIMALIHVPFTVFIMRDPIVNNKKEATKLSLHDIIKNAINLIKKDKKVILVVLGMAILPSLLIVLGRFKIYICGNIGMSVHEIANVEAMSHFVQFLAAVFSLIALKLLRYKLSFIHSMVILLILLVAVVLANVIYGTMVVYTIIVFCAVYPTISTSVKGVLEPLLPYEMRTTISSANSFLFSLFNAFFLMLMGVVAELYSYQIALFVILGISIIFVLCLIYRYLQLEA